MFKKILGVSLLCMSASALAQNTTSLDALFNINSNNFCYQQNSPVQKNLSSFINFMPNTSLVLARSPILSLKSPAPTIVEEYSGEQLRGILLKEDENKFKSADPLKNVFSITHNVNIEVAGTPVQTVQFLSRNFSGLKFASDAYAGQAVLKDGSIPNLLSQFKNTKEYGVALEQAARSTIAFTLLPTEKGTVINYSCTIRLVTDKTKAQIAQELNIK